MSFNFMVIVTISTMILEPKKIKSVTVSIFSRPICHEMMGPFKPTIADDAKMAELMSSVGGTLYGSEQSPKQLTEFSVFKSNFFILSSLRNRHYSIC